MSMKERWSVVVLEICSLAFDVETKSIQHRR